MLMALSSTGELCPKIEGLSSSDPCITSRLLHLLQQYLGLFVLVFYWRRVGIERGWGGMERNCCVFSWLVFVVFLLLFVSLICQWSSEAFIVLSVVSSIWKGLLPENCRKCSEGGQCEREFGLVWCSLLLRPGEVQHLFTLVAWPCSKKELCFSISLSVDAGAAEAVVWIWWWAPSSPQSLCGPVIPSFLLLFLLPRGLLFTHSLLFSWTGRALCNRRSVNSPLGRIWKFTFLDSYFMLSVAQADIIQDGGFFCFFFLFSFCRLQIRS